MNTTETKADLKQPLEAELGRLMQTPIGQRIAAIQVLLGGGVSPATIADRNNGHEQPRGRRGPGVSDVKLRAVRQYMENTRIARQSDIAKDLNENSGSVSLAMRELESRGDVEDTGKIDRKSKVWKFIGEPERVTNVNPGDGVEAGRRR